MPSSEGSTATSQSLERGLAILSSFHPDRPLIGVSELSRELDLSRSTAHRYVATLAKLGYLQQDPDSKRYRLGPKVLDLGFSAINSMDLREISAPHLRLAQRRDGLHGQSGDPRRDRRRLHRALPDGSARPAGDRPQSPRGRTAARLLHGDGEGDPRLRPRGSLEEIIERIDFAPRGPNTLTDPEAFREELRKIRAAGIAVNDEELAYGLRSIAAPIHSQLRRGGRRAQPRRPPNDGLDGRADRALRPCGHPVGARHLAEHGAQVGAL